MRTFHRSVCVLGAVTIMGGCATREPAPDKMPPSAAGTDNITDNSDAAFFLEGSWITSSSSSGFLGNNYNVIAPGRGDNYSVWNIETIQEYEVSARWSAHSNRASNAKFVIHYIDDSGRTATDTVTVNQRQNGGEWVQLGIYRMSNLTGRVTLSDDADGYVVADAVRFRSIDHDDTDSDADGLPDWYEISYGLDPNNAADADFDLDGDGISNINEFLTGSDPSVSGSDSVVPPPDPDAGPGGDGSVTLSWSPPTARENGERLELSDIASYEVEYYPAVDSTPLLVDDESQFFQLYGSVGPSSYTKGFIGSGYHPLPPGNGEILAEWAVYELVPSITYSLEAHWVSGSNRSKSAPFTVNYVDQSGSVQEEVIRADQTKGGGDWQKLIDITPMEGSIMVNVSNASDGYVIADAIRLVPQSGDDAYHWPVDPADGTSTEVKGLTEGEWAFRVRAIDIKGVAGRYSDPVTYEVR